MIRLKLAFQSSDPYSDLKSQFPCPQVESLSRDIEKKRGQYEEAAAEVARLKQELEEMIKVSDGIKGANSALRETNARLEGDVDGLKEAKDGLKRDLATANSHVARLKAEMEVSRGSMEEKEVELESALRDVQRLKCELEGSQKEAVHLNSELEETRKQFEANVSIVTQENASLRQEIADLVQQVGRLEQSAAESQTEVDQVQSEHTRLVQLYDSALREARAVHGSLVQSEDEIPIGGIGVHIKAPEDAGGGDDYDDMAVYVDRLVEGGAAAASGKISAGDEMLEVSGRELAGLDADGVKSLIVGPVGTPVTIKGKRCRDGSKYTVTLIRMGGTAGGSSFDVEKMAETSRHVAEEMHAELVVLKSECVRLRQETERLESEGAGSRKLLAASEKEVEVPIAISHFIKPV